MKKALIGLAAAIILTALITSVFAGVKTNNGNGGWQVNGPHYNLQILGKDKHGEVGDSDGHTMFVKLNGKTKIVMTQAEDGEFKVVDRNGLDGRAEFNIAPGHYNIYARALGKPGGKADITAWGEFEDEETGTKLLQLGYVQITRNNKKPQSVNINELFYVDVMLCTAVNASGDCIEWVVYTDYWVFDIEELLEYYWDYNNQGLKLLQVRLYECTIDPSMESNDYCRWGDGTPIEPTKQTVVAS